jgi:hypothetical protein
MMQSLKHVDKSLKHVERVLYMHEWVLLKTSESAVWLAFLLGPTDFTTCMYFVWCCDD